MSVELVHARASEDTIAAVAALLQEVRDAQVIGVAFIALHQGHAYYVEIAGEALRRPTLTRGALAALDDQLSKIVLG